MSKKYFLGHLLVCKSLISEGHSLVAVVALRAILKYDKNLAKKRKFGSIAVFVDDKQDGEPIAFTDTSESAINLPNLSEVLTPGELRMDAGNAMPYSIALNYSAPTPQSSNKCAVAIDVKMSDTKLSAGSSAEALVTVTRTMDAVIPIPVAIVGVPGGMEVRHDQLRELVAKGTLDHFEVHGGEVILYWCGMKENAKLEVPVS